MLPVLFFFPHTLLPATNKHLVFCFFSAHFSFLYPAFLSLHFSPPLNRSRLTWKTQPSTTSSAPSSSRWSATWESLALRRWACPATTSPLTTGACRQGRATAPPTALWPYWPWTLTARKRWLSVHRFIIVSLDDTHLIVSRSSLYMSSCCRWMMSLMTLLVWSPVTVMTSLAWWTQDFRWLARYVGVCTPFALTHWKWMYWSSH